MTEELCWIPGCELAAKWLPGLKFMDVHGEFLGYARLGAPVCGAHGMELTTEKLLSLADREYFQKEVFPGREIAFGRSRMMLDLIESR